MRYNIDVLRERYSESVERMVKIETVSSKNVAFTKCLLFRFTSRRAGVCEHMAGNPWYPRVRQIRGGRAAAILEPISKSLVD